MHSCNVITVYADLYGITVDKGNIKQSLKNRSAKMKKITDGKSIVNLECDDVVWTKISRMFEGYFYFAEEADFINDDDEYTIIVKEEKRIIPHKNCNILGLHCNKRGYYYDAPDNVCCIVNTDDNIIYEISYKEAIIYGNWEAKEFLIDTVRLIRAYFEIKMLSHGFKKQHMCVASDGKTTYGIIGEKGAGKTTMLLFLLKNHYSLLSNDKAFVSKNGEAYGFCQRIGIQEYTMKKYGLYDVRGDKIGDKYYYWPIELVKLCDSQTIRSAKIDKIIVANYKANIDVRFDTINSQEEKKRLYDTAIDSFTDASSMNEIQKIIAEKKSLQIPSFKDEIFSDIQNLDWIKVTGEFEKINNVIG